MREVQHDMRGTAWRERGGMMREAAVQQERWQCGKRGGNSTTSRHERDVGETRDEAMQQPASTREAQCNMRDGGVTKEMRVVRQGVARQGGAQRRQGVARWWQGVAWWGVAWQRHKGALCGAVRWKAAWQKIIWIESFHWRDPPPCAALCAAVVLALQPVSTLRQCVPNESCTDVLLIAPSIVKCDAIVEYARAIQWRQCNEDAGATVVAASDAGQQREHFSYFLNPPADPIRAANKVDREQCRCHSPCAIVCAAVMTAVLPLAAIPSLAFVVLPCCPLLSLSLSCHPPPCCPLLSSSRHAAPCCVAQCRHCTTLHWRNPPPRAAFCAAIMLTDPPLVNATLLPLKDKIWIWQNEFYLQIK